MDLIEMFKTLFGTYAPIQNVASVIQEGENTVTTYAYSIDWSAITHFALIVILFWTVCKVCGTVITNMSRSVTLR